MTTDRRTLVGLGAVATIVVGLLGWLIATDPGPARTLPAPPRPRAGRPAPEAPRPARGRVSLPRPTSPSPGAAPRPLDGNAKYELNATVDEAVRAARDACLVPYVNGLADPEEVEFVLDVVVVDGQVADFGFRAPGGDEVPPDVVQCLADEVWGVDWPRFAALEAETRLQRSFTVRPAPP